MPRKLNLLEKVYITEKTAPEIAKKAKGLGISLTTHAPYAINLCSNAKSVVEASKRMILDSLRISEMIGSECVATHIAYYSGLKPEQAIETLKINIKNIFDKMKQQFIQTFTISYKGYISSSYVNKFKFVHNYIGIPNFIKNVVLYATLIYVSFIVRRYSNT